MENHFVKMTGRVFAVIFSIMFVLTLCGIIFNGAWWHIYTLIVTGILSVLFWTEKEDPKDNSPIKHQKP